MSLRGHRVTYDTRSLISHCEERSDVAIPDSCGAIDPQGLSLRGAKRRGNLREGNAPDVCHCEGPKGPVAILSHRHCEGHEVARSNLWTLAHNWVGIPKVRKKRDCFGRASPFLAMTKQLRCNCKGYSNSTR